MSVHVSPLVFLERPLICFVLFVLVCVCLCLFFGLVLVVVVVLFCFHGLSSHETSQSSNDSLLGVAKTATIVMMSAAMV